MGQCANVSDSRIQKPNKLERSIKAKCQMADSEFEDVRKQGEGNPQQQNAQQINDDPQDVFNPNNSVSKIYRKGKKKIVQKPEKETHQKEEVQADKGMKQWANQIKQQDQQQQTYDSVDPIIEEMTSTGFSVYDEGKLSIEFIIPKTRAGPFLAPFIDYTFYAQFHEPQAQGDEA